MRLIVCGFWCLLLSGGSVATAADFLQSYCLDCHGPKAQEAGLRIDKLGAESADEASLAAWVRVYDRVAKREMPPQDAEAPGDADREAFLKSLQTKLHSASIADQMRDGRVRMRRLNRSEYEHTLHDLLGVTTSVKALLPEDNTAGGFDKVSDGLEISATHLVRYQQAADAALRDVLPSEIIKPASKLHRWTGKGFLDSRPVPNREGTAPFVRFEGETIILCAQLYKHGSVLTAPATAAGRYRVRASVRAVNTGGKPISVLLGRISCDRFAHERLEHILDYQDAPADRSREIEVTSTLIAGEQVYLEGLGLPFFGKLKEERKGAPVGDDFAGPGLAVDWVEIEGPLDAGVGYRDWYGGLPRVPHRFYDDAKAGKEISTDWSKWHPNEFNKPQHRLRLVSPDPAADAERLIRAFLPRAFRRPVSEELLASYLKPAKERMDAGEPLEDVLTETYKAALCSPHFLMLVEKPGKLDDFALAARLAYFLWDSAPDEELLAVAGRGELQRPEVLRTQTERLLKDRKAERFVESFTGQWLDLRKFHDMKPDEMYVEYDELLAWSMPEETRAFFREVLRNDLPATSFFHSDWSMLNERLATHYGLEGVRGLELRKTPLSAESHRGGVLTQASFLKLSTNATYTSPVKRGVWVLERLLGTPPSPPPPSIAAIEPDIRGAVTIREQLAKHQAVAACAACHKQIDPPGFALENFDVVGGWRERYRVKHGGEGKDYTDLARYPGKRVWLAKPVEANGKTAAGDEFADIDAYRQLVLRNPDQLVRNLAEKLLVYSTGGTIQFADRAAIEDITAKVRAQKYGFRSLLHEVVQSRVFQSK